MPLEVAIEAFPGILLRNEFRLFDEGFGLVENAQTRASAERLDLVLGSLLKRPHHGDSRTPEKWWKTFGAFRGQPDLRGSDEDGPHAFGRRLVGDDPSIPRTVPQLREDVQTEKLT